MNNFFSLMFFCLAAHTSFAQVQAVEDDFEGAGTINSWFGDDCGMDLAFNNPYLQGLNTSLTVLKYNDAGGQYANIRFDVSENFNLSTNHTFSLKIFVPASGISGNQNNQLSLKLQDGTIGAPWETQCEIIKNITLNEWQELSFDFDLDPYINLNPGSGDPLLRSDFNRVVLQVNGENNNDIVTAYLDDVNYDGTLGSCSVFNTLVWSDEFDGNGPVDETKWFHQTLLPNGWGWFNGELQHYTNRVENSYVQNGFLHIVAKDETFTDQGVTKEYTSARLNSKFAFTYGRVEARAKMPFGIGTWPAIWMLGKNINENGAYWQTQGFGTTSWPACGEIDILEHWGSNQNYVQSALHTPSSSGATVNHGGTMSSDVSNTFHLYAMEWTEEKIEFSVDGYVYYTYEPEPQNMSTWPFVADQFLLLNVAVQNSIESSFNESDMVLDYIRVYQQGSASTTIDVQEACDSYTWVDGNTYTESNNLSTFILPNVEGCDSIITLDLTINNSITSTDAHTACDSYEWVNGIVYTESNNTDELVFSTLAGCDSIIALDLIINYSSSALISETTTDVFELNGFTYNDSGTYTQVIANSMGCDSTITLNLTIENTAVLDEKHSEIIISPNPVDDYLNLIIEPNYLADKILILSITGEIVLTQIPENSSFQIDCSSLVPGKYYVAFEKDSITKVSFVKI
ncbi:family 16 glycosylhydrolase [Crocinitomicaceae bacterium]|nr:family 16 glycosylhydrolase [Crocinitomicaceae bacterium]